MFMAMIIGVFAEGRQTGTRAGVTIEEFRCEIRSRSARCMKARTQSVLACPPWPKGGSGKAWLFADELVIE